MLGLGLLWKNRKGNLKIQTIHFFCYILFNCFYFSGIWYKHSEFLFKYPQFVCHFLLHQIDIRKSYTHSTPFSYDVGRYKRIRIVYCCIIRSFPQLNKRMVYIHYISGKSLFNLLFHFSWIFPIWLIFLSGFMFVFGNYSA